VKEIIFNKKLGNGKSFGKLKGNRMNEASEGAAPCSFKDIFGDLTEYIYKGDLDLSQLNLSSLEGCPQKLKEGYFAIDNNPNLKSLENLPSSSGKFYIGYDNIYLFDKIEINKYKHFNIYICDIPFQNHNPMVTVKNIIFFFAKFRMLNGDFNKLKNFTFLSGQELNYVDLEKYYAIYEKVNFNREKFNQVLELF